MCYVAQQQYLVIEIGKYRRTITRCIQNSDNNNGLESRQRSTRKSKQQAASKREEWEHVQKGKRACSGLLAAQCWLSVT